MPSYVEKYDSDARTGLVKDRPKPSGDLPSRAGFPDVPTPRMGRVWLTSSDGDAVHATLFEAPAERSYEAGWEELERRRRSNALDFAGRPLEGWDLSLLFDGFLTRENVEADCEMLSDMAKPATRGALPPTIRVAGVAPIRGRDWVIVSREPAEQESWVWRNRRRVRAFYTVSLVEAVFPNLVEIRPAKRTRDRQGKRKPRTYVVKSSDKSLRGIAQRVLGDGDRWREITRIDGRTERVRDGKNIQPGERLRLP